VVDVPGVTGSALFGAGPIAREPDPGGVVVDGGVVVWAREAPEISVTIPVTMMSGLSIDGTPNSRAQFTVFNTAREGRVPAKGSAHSTQQVCVHFSKQRNEKERRLVVGNQAPTIEMKCTVSEISHACRKRYDLEFVPLRCPEWKRTVLSRP
jgi:hypothetical protein